MKRTLRLKSETLADLSSAELRAVQGGEWSTPNCLSDKFNCRVSDMIMSLCGCLTSYCSIEVC